MCNYMMFCFRNVSLSDTMKAMKEHDPHKPDYERDTLMSRIFQVPVSKVKASGNIELTKAELLVNIEATNVALSGPSP